MSNAFVLESRRVPLLPSESEPRLLSLNGRYIAATVPSRVPFSMSTRHALIHAESSFLVCPNELIFEDLSHRNYDPLWWFNDQDPCRWGFESTQVIWRRIESSKWPDAPSGVFLPPMGNFGHFMFEMLPRLSLLNSLGERRVFTTDRLPTRFVSLAKQLFPELTINVVPHAPFFVGKEDTNIVSAPMGRGTNKQLSASLYPFIELRRRGLILAGTGSTSGGRKVYVSRGQRGKERRVVENEDEVISLLRDRGYESIDPSSLDWSEQIRVFSQASEVVGVFGSHMLSCIFMRPASKLIIAFPPNLALNYQSYIPMLLGVNLFTVSASRTILREGSAHLDSDLIVNLEALVNAVEAPAPNPLPPFLA